MTAFAEKETARSRLMAKQRQEPDEDGFVTVTRGGRTGPARQEAAQEQAEKLKSKQKGLEDFYRFQTREKRKARAGELVRKFEEDKEKVRKMKERRGKFKVGFDGLHYRDVFADWLLSLSEIANLWAMINQTTYVLERMKARQKMCIYESISSLMHLSSFAHRSAR